MHWPSCFLNITLEKRKTSEWFTLQCLKSDRSNNQDLGPFYLFPLQSGLWLLLSGGSTDRDSRIVSCLFPCAQLPGKVYEQHILRCVFTPQKADSDCNMWSTNIWIFGLVMTADRYHFPLRGCAAFGFPWIQKS